MNRLKSIVLFVSMSLLACSCGKEESVIEYKEVTPNNISGDWALVEWNGSKLSEGTYMYVTFVRKDKEFTMYQNFDSMSLPHVVTGNYNIVSDVELGAVIRGSYNYDAGDWAHSYVVMNLTATSMTWVATDDPTYVQKFIRSEIPSEIKQ